MIRRFVLAVEAQAKLIEPKPCKTLGDLCSNCKIILSPQSFPPSASYSKILHVKTVGSWNWPEVVIAFKRFSSVSHLGIKLLTEICCIANKCRDSLLQKDILFISRYNLTKNPYSCSQLRFRSLQCCLDWRSKG